MHCEGHIGHHRTKKLPIDMRQHSSSLGILHCGAYACPLAVKGSTSTSLTRGQSGRKSRSAASSVPMNSSKRDEGPSTVRTYSERLSHFDPSKIAASRPRTRTRTSTVLQTQATDGVAERWMKSGRLAVTIQGACSGLAAALKHITVATVLYHPYWISFRHPSDRKATLGRACSSVPH